MDLLKIRVIATTIPAKAGTTNLYTPGQEREPFVVTPIDPCPAD
jgi:hypothetical protein